MKKKEELLGGGITSIFAAEQDLLIFNHAFWVLNLSSLSILGSLLRGSTRYTLATVLVGGRVAKCTYIDLIRLEFRGSIVIFNLGLKLKPVEKAPLPYSAVP